MKQNNFMPEKYCFWGWESLFFQEPWISPNMHALYGQEYLIRKNVDILTKVNKSLKSHIILLFINHRKKNWPKKIKFPLKWWKSRLNPVNQAGENRGSFAEIKRRPVTSIFYILQGRLASNFLNSRNLVMKF